jgi:radical SAM protein with 4Fe4S-binding SPASM domain
MVQYLCDTYCMYRYVVTTNGLVLLNDPGIREWVLRHKYHLNLSVSISALRGVLGEGYLDKAGAVLDLVKTNGGDVHYVVDDPERPGIYEEIIRLYEYGVPVVRLSSARHWDLVRDKNKQFKDLFRRVADYVYFSGEPKFGRSQWDIALKNNIYRKLKGIALKDVPPTFCGCGYLYLAVNNRGEIYPCDFFANYPEFKIGDVWSGFNDTAFFFKKMGDWIDELYEHCRDCEVCFDGDIRCCPRAMCLAENYTVTGNPLKPAANHCWANRIETATYEYIAKKAIETGIDSLYHKGAVRK